GPIALSLLAGTFSLEELCRPDPADGLSAKELLFSSGISVETLNALRMLDALQSKRLTNEFSGSVVRLAAANTRTAGILEYCLKTLKLEPNANDNVGCTPLHCASANAQLLGPKLDLLCGEFKLDINARTSDGRTLLHLLCNSPTLPGSAVRLLVA